MPLFISTDVFIDCITPPDGDFYQLHICKHLDDDIKRVVIQRSVELPQYLTLRGSSMVRNIRYDQLCLFGIFRLSDTTKYLGHILLGDLSVTLWRA